jgi:hypothetical protein
MWQRPFHQRSAFYPVNKRKAPSADQRNILLTCLEQDEREITPEGGD